mgnify:CR=1 FL=1
MNKIKSIFFISFLAISSATLADHKGLQGLKFIPSAHDAIVGGCTLGSLGPAYSHALCNSDGSYNENASTGDIFEGMKKLMNSHTHPIVTPSELHMHNHYPLGLINTHGIPAHPIPGRTY